ncbi:MAG TPA: hypothetical protein VK442_07185 [Xanthobacteraceae bacterium]|nr:hypothetical protein [Xanthobacteraceae bacterium]
MRCQAHYVTFAMSRCWLVIVAIVCLSGVVAHAQIDRLEREVKAAAGRDVRIGVYTNIRPDCTAGPLPAIRLIAAPAHGAVTVKRATLKATNLRQCLGVEVPAFVAFYRAAEGFNGADEFELEIGLAGDRKRLQHFRIDVSAKPGVGQGI